MLAEAQLLELLLAYLSITIRDCMGIITALSLPVLSAEIPGAITYNPSVHCEATLSWIFFYLCFILF